MTRNDRDSLRFAEQIGGSESVTLTHEMNDPATLEEVRVRIYRGAEQDVHVTPWIKEGGEDGHKVPLITFQGKEFVDGDDDHFKFPVVAKAPAGAIVGVDVRNVEPDYAYDFSVDVDLEYMGGAGRVADAARGLLERMGVA